MTDEEIKAYIDTAIRRTVEEYKRAGLLVDGRGAAYSDAAEMLERYFADGKTNNAITYAMQAIRFDPYFRVLELYFEKRQTNEAIAELMGVDLSTIVRNKRRLCLKIYNDVT